MSKNKAKRVKKAATKKQQKPLPPAPTANAKIIRDLMAANKVKGKYKDYVIIAGNRLIDWVASYDIIKTEDDGSVRSAGVDGMALIHKRNLVNIIGADMASKFWRNGRRTNYGVESRRLNCATRQG